MSKRRFGLDERAKSKTTEIAAKGCTEWLPEHNGKDGPNHVFQQHPLACNLFLLEI